MISPEHLDHYWHIVNNPQWAWAWHFLLGQVLGRSWTRWTHRHQPDHRRPPGHTGGHRNASGSP